MKTPFARPSAFLLCQNVRKWLVVDRRGCGLQTDPTRSAADIRHIMRRLERVRAWRWTQRASGVGAEARAEPAVSAEVRMYAVGNVAGIVTPAPGSAEFVSPSALLVLALDSLALHEPFHRGTPPVVAAPSISSADVTRREISVPSSSWTSQSLIAV